MSKKTKIRCDMPHPMSYVDAECAIISIMQRIADDLGLSDDEFDSIGYAIDVLDALGFEEVGDDE